MSTPPKPTIHLVKCPVCSKMIRYEDGPFRPFCSKACKDRDLGNWATERYKISDPTDPPPVSEE